MTSLLLFFLLFLLSFVVLPFGVSHYEIPKVIFAEVCIFILGSIYFLSSRSPFRSWRERTVEAFVTIPKPLQSNQPMRYVVPNVLLLLGFFFLSLYTLMFNHSSVMFLGNSYRLQGTFLFWVLLGFAAIGSAIPLRVYKPIIFLGLLIGQLYFALSGIVNAEGRAVGTLGEPNALAATAVFLWPWVLWKVEPSTLQKYHLGKGIAIFFALGMSICILILSGSRSGLLALGIQMFFLIGCKFASLKHVTLASIVLLCLSLLLPLTDKQTIYENRGDVWKTALIAGYEHPLAGWGFGNVEVAMKEYNRRLYNNLQGYYVDSAHNFLLDMWVSGGLVGLSFLILLLFQMIKRFVADENAFLIVLLLGVITVMSFNPVSIVTLVHFWWLASHTNHL